MPMIPTKRNRLVQLPVDAAIYALRNMVERGCPMISQIIGCCAQQAQERTKARKSIRQNR